ncbi:hypothetical protein EVAR_13035_1 [Eumeta japonica]|uniref:Uncharacterized protein n=1 Tax=Eumeta variegata TaxID=151549 RepID=A0A4C1VGF8_EUMVA|nr:hypothetical protein EVAR_13035_1 [Eumeta japonica]
MVYILRTKFRRRKLHRNTADLCSAPADIFFGRRGPAAPARAYARAALLAYDIPKTMLYSPAFYKGPFPRGTSNDFVVDVTYGQISMQANRVLVAIAAQLHSQPQRWNQCVADLLERNRISSERGNGLMEGKNGSNIYAAVELASSLIRSQLVTSFHVIRQSSQRWQFIDTPPRGAGGASAARSVSAAPAYTIDFRAPRPARAAARTKLYVGSEQSDPSPAEGRLPLCARVCPVSCEISAFRLRGRM